MLIGSLKYNETIQRARVLKKIKVGFRVFFSILGFAVIPALYPIVALTALQPIQSLPYLAAVLMMIAALSVNGFMSQRTERGAELMGKIMGLKHFIEVAEKDRLELLVKENPSYYFNILPFAYVLGVTNVWIKKFETIAIQPPEWYTSPYGGYGWNYMFMTK
jgi:hypothetical protein